MERLYGISLASWNMTAVALSSTSVIYVVAAEAAPVIRTRHIPLWSLPRTLRFRVVTLLAAVSEVEIQISTLVTIPFPMRSRLPLTRTRTGTIFFLPLFISLPIRIS